MTEENPEENIEITDKTSRNKWTLTEVENSSIESDKNTTTDKEEVKAKENRHEYNQAAIEQENGSDKNNDDENKSFWTHLEELRKRLIYIAISFVVIFLAIWTFRNDILNIYLIQIVAAIDANSGELVLLKIMDKFYIHLKTSIFFTIVTILPIIYYHIWRFISPGLFKRERLGFSFLGLGSLTFFYLGLITAYFLVIPYGVEYLVKYSTDTGGIIKDLIAPNKLTLSLSDYVEFTQKFLLIFGFIFQTPLLMVIVTRLGIINISSIIKYRRHSYILCLSISAFFTPPDPVTMLGMGLPLIVLFEVGIVLSKIFIKRKEEDQ